MRKILYIIIAYISIFNSKIVFWDPTIFNVDLPGSTIWVDDIVSNIWWDIISTLIQYVAVIAVISLIISWIMYLLSWWEEEKVKKAKNWIIWSLVWVLLAISAYWIINLINQLSISN